MRGREDFHNKAWKLLLGRKIKLKQELMLKYQPIMQLITTNSATYFDKPSSDHEGLTLETD